MKIFVASWFFPPATSSEGIVTYKLLRNSKNDYDVFSSRSKLWGYKAEMKVNDENNIHSYSIETDDIDEWVAWTVKQFEDRYQSEQYDCIMTRSTPPESVIVGEKIKEKYPEVKWIASLADPIANNPYEIKAYVDDNPNLSDSQKVYLKNALKTDGDELINEWEKRPEAGIKLLCKLRKWEDMVLQKADYIISPTSRQLRYLLRERPWQSKLFPLPHSFDETFYKKANNKNEKVVLAFLGYTDKLRSLSPIIKAVKQLKEDGSKALDNIDIQIYGNNPRDIQDMVINYYLDDYVHFYPGVDYYKSLEIMQKADWLIHIDAYFSDIYPGGSIFFAGKLADYMGARKPILAITGDHSPAYRIIKKYGGESFEYLEIDKIAECIEEIGYGYKVKINDNYRENYNAINVAKLFDEKIRGFSHDNYKLNRSIWPNVGDSKTEKILSICVPSYNVEKYLDRCLYTLVNHEMAPYLDIMVVDDGSKDHTADIGKEYENKYPGIVRLISKENGGHGSTINKAIKEAKGLYFRTVDGDDWVDSVQLSELIKYIINNRISVDVISSNYHEINIESAELTPIEQDKNIEFEKIYSFSEIDPDKVYLTLASMLIKTDVLRAMNMDLQEHTFYVDVEFILFPVPYIKTIIFTKHFIYKYARGNAEQSVAIPNMVNRYDHHNRVMHRVIKYGNSVKMSEEQKDYYDAILKRLLCTHFFLCLAYDKDKKRGCSRARRFDAFLHKERPDLARWIGQELRVVKVARQCKYDYKRFEHSILLFIEKSGKYALDSLYRTGKTVANTNFMKHIVYNKATISIAQSEFFTEGKGKAIKDKVNNLFGN